jgi:hypothetical protein
MAYRPGRGLAHVAEPKMFFSETSGETSFRALYDESKAEFHLKVERTGVKKLLDIQFDRHSEIEIKTKKIYVRGNDCEYCFQKNDDDYAVLSFDLDIAFVVELTVPFDRLHTLFKNVVKYLEDYKKLTVLHALRKGLHIDLGHHIGPHIFEYAGLKKVDRSEIGLRRMRAAEERDDREAKRRAI